MSYLAVGEVYGGNVDDMILFCWLTSFRGARSYHAEFLEKELMTQTWPWPVYLDSHEIYRLLERTYKKAVEKHFRLKSTGPLPRRIQFMAHQMLLRYRCYGTIITLDMAYAPAALMLVQGYSAEAVSELAVRGHLGPVVQTCDERVLLPIEATRLQLSLGTVSNLFKK